MSLQERENVWSKQGSIPIWEAPAGETAVFPDSSQDFDTRQTREGRKPYGMGRKLLIMGAAVCTSLSAAVHFKLIEIPTRMEPPILAGPGAENDEITKVYSESCATAPQTIAGVTYRAGFRVCTTATGENVNGGDGHARGNVSKVLVRFMETNGDYPISITSMQDNLVTDGNLETAQLELALGRQAANRSINEGMVALYLVEDQNTALTVDGRPVWVDVVPKPLGPVGVDSQEQQNDSPFYTPTSTQP